MTTKESIIRRILTLMLITAAALMLMPLRTFADNVAFISTPESDVPLGTDFDITVTFNADSRIGTVQAALSYSEQDISFVSSDYAYGSGGIVNINAFPQEQSTNMIVRLTFHALRQGSSAITLTNGSIMSPDGSMLAGALSSTAMVTVGESRAVQPDTNSSAEADENALEASLKSLTVSSGELKPAFSPGIYDYTVTVPHDVDYFGIDAEPANPMDGIWFEGSEYLADGITIRTITVTSATSMESNVYTVKITRLSAEDSEDDEQTLSESESTDGQNSADVSTASVETKQTNKNSVSPRDPNSSRTVSEEETSTLHDKLTPIMIAAIVLILVLIALLMVHINKKSRNRLGASPKRKPNNKRKR